MIMTITLDISIFKNYLKSSNDSNETKRSIFINITNINNIFICINSIINMKNILLMLNRGSK